MNLIICQVINMGKFIVYKIIVKSKTKDNNVTFAYDTETERDNTFKEVTSKLRNVNNESDMFFLWGDVMFNLFDISTVMKREETLPGEKQEEK